MPFDKVLVINASESEVECIGRLTAEFDTAIRVVSVRNDLQAAISAVATNSLRLIVLRMSDSLGRGDQVIKRLKSSMMQPVPLLLLVPAELTGQLRRYIRVGADDYWVLPLDTTAFASRLTVMLEWGQTMIRSAALTTGSAGSNSVGSRCSLKDRIRVWARRLFAANESTDIGPAPENAATIGGYWDKEKRLGFGSFGEVWLVKARDGDTRAVAKIPHDKKLNTRFLQEAAILKRLAEHPNAVKLIEVLKEGGKVILIQEYVAGPTLQELIDEGMDSITKENAFLQLVEVVACAHRERIVHRDIKPENIIITHDGVLKLLDFGTGKDLVKRSISSTVVGSRPFMAPEQIMGQSRVASDVWALGVLLYALATECLPFYADNEKELMDLILEVPPEAPRSLEPGIPLPLNDVILKCLVKPWQDRYPNAGALKEALLTELPEFGSGAVLL